MSMRNAVAATPVAVGAHEGAPAEGAPVNAGQLRSALPYRREVDGLRAVAVLPVVLYHAGTPGFQGGFVGVDIFFVISGYLISGLLCRELSETGRISIRGFLERRIRRLAPALLLVLVTTLLLGAVFLSPIGGEQQGLARSAIAALALSANLYFWHFSGGYFDGLAELQPLLHLWSLSVEEQFYLVWPWCLLALYARLGKGGGKKWQRLLTMAMAAVCAASFALCVVSSWLHTETAFYLTPMRAWEFAAGALVYVVLERSCRESSRMGDALAVVGLLLIATAVITFNRSIQYPGAWALVPVAGTMAVLAGTALSPRGVATRLLGWRPIVALGLVSYAWYLWHWPLLTFARVQGLGELRAVPAAAMVGLSLVLAAMTYRYLEVPIRSRRIRLMANRRQTWRTAAFGMATGFALAAVLGIWSKWVWPALPGNDRLARALGDMRKVRVDCGAAAPYHGTLPAGPQCQGGAAAGSSGRRLIVWGDSHAAHLVPLLEAFSRQAGTSFLIRYMPQCPPLIGFDPALLGLKGVGGCPEFNRDVLTEITLLRMAGQLDAVVLNARWTGYSGSAADLGRVQAGLTRTLDSLQALGIRAVVFAPAPDMPFEVPPCLLRRAESVCDLDKGIGEQHRSAVLRVMEQLAKPLHASIVDPFAALCDAQACPSLHEGAVLYSDSHHLSVAGSTALLAVAAPVLAWAVGTGDGAR